MNELPHSIGGIHYCQIFFVKNQVKFREEIPKIVKILDRNHKKSSMLKRI